MAVSTVKEIHDGRDGDDSIAQGGKGAQHYTRVFRVITDSNTTESETVLLNPLLPWVGDVYPYNSNAYLQGKTARNEGFSKRVWIVTLAYSTEREMNQDPVADPALISWDTEMYQEPFHKDIDGKPASNSAGDPLDPVPERDDPRVTATIIKNLTAVPFWIFAYRRAVNDDAFWIDGLLVPAGLAKVSSVRVSSPQTRNQISYRVVTMQIQVREEFTNAIGNPLPPGHDDTGKEWHVSPLDAGFRQRVTGPTGGDVMSNIVNDDLSDITAPVPLDGAGKVEPNPTVDNAKYVHLKSYPELDFSVLPLV